MKAKKKYECPECDELYDDESEAAACCPPDIPEKWECTDCKEIHDEEDEAVACCGGITETGLPIEAFCHFCNAPCFKDDLRDSRLIGSRDRCRACLNNVGVPSVEQVIAA